MLAASNRSKPSAKRARARLSTRAPRPAPGGSRFGPATATIIGKLKIMELRGIAMRELGDDFDYRGFHDMVLLSGPVPLSMLEERANAWVAKETRGG